MICRARRLIFVHIPKTAGTSIEDVIWTGRRTTRELWGGLVSTYSNRYQTGGLQHLQAAQIRHAVGRGLFDRCFRFSVVRNPWDKAVSQYASMVRSRPDLLAFLDFASIPSFDAYLERIGRRPHVQWLPQKPFLVDTDGRTPLVDTILRFETMAGDWAALAGRLDLPGTLGHRNASERRPYQDYYSDRSIGVVGDLYGEDIAAFGYAFAPA